MKCLLLACVVVLSILSLSTVNRASFADDAKKDSGADSAASVARAYIAACEKGDLDALNALFLSDGKATVLENASDEGTWENYRDHHLAPELKEMPGFKFTVEKETEQKLGMAADAASIVRQVGSFTVPDPQQPAAKRAYRAAVTYVIVTDAGKPKIAHLHWSSRAQRAPATQPGQLPR